MQQVGAKGFADAELVDPRHLPAPLNRLSRRARVNFGYAWVLHRRAILRLAAAGVLMAGAVGLYQGREMIGEGVAALAEVAQGGFARAGFGLTSINISGQVLTSEAAILRALALDPAMSTLNFDADGALARIKAIPSIKSATIRKIYPGELVVTVEEKVPMARWRIGETTYLVDENGGPVARDDGSFRELPLVVGPGAADHAIAMIRTLERYPSVSADLAALSRIGNRRWDLIFYSGLRVQLPESGVAQALSHLAAYQAEHQLLDRDVEVIDLRVPGMVSLKLGELAIKAREDAAKAAGRKAPTLSRPDPDYQTPAARAAEANTL